MATLPTSPPTLPSASAICPDGTATTTTSASVASPPSRPTAVTAWPARSQRRASPPPTLPLPSTKMFTLPPCRWPYRAAGPIPPAWSGAAAQAGADLRHDLGDSLVRSARPCPLHAGSTPSTSSRHYRRRWSAVRPCAGPMGQYWGMRIVSLLPSATEIVYTLGLEAHLVGVTDECDWPPRPAPCRSCRVRRCRRPPNRPTSTGWSAPASAAASQYTGSTPTPSATCAPTW